MSAQSLFATLRRLLSWKGSDAEPSRAASLGHPPPSSNPEPIQAPRAVAAPFVPAEGQGERLEIEFIERDRGLPDGVASAKPEPVQDARPVAESVIPAEEQGERRQEDTVERPSSEQLAQFPEQGGDSVEAVASQAPVNMPPKVPARRVPLSAVIGASDTISGAIVFLYNGRAFSAAVDRGRAWHELNRLMIAATGRDFALALGPDVVKLNNAAPQPGHWIYIYRDRVDFLKATRGTIEFREWRFCRVDFPPSDPPRLPPLRSSRAGSSPDPQGDVSENTQSALQTKPWKNDSERSGGPMESVKPPTLPDEPKQTVREQLRRDQAPQFQLGAKVRLAERPEKVGRVVAGPIKTATGYDYTVLLQGAEHEETYSEAALEPADSPAYAVVERDEFLRELLLFKLSGKISDVLYSFPSSRTLFRVYQYKPVLKFLRSPDHRLLIADEVGLGKTIEAGIIYLEWKSRLRRMRTLVVCPSALREKWRLEMLNRFDEDFTILDSAKLKHFLEHYERYGQATTLRGIISLELLRLHSRELEERAVHFDLVIVDEAHHLRNSRTQSYGLGEILSAQADALLFLTATPIHLGTPDLFNLLRLLKPDEYVSSWLFEQQIEPNKHITHASRLLRANDAKGALRALQEVKQTALGQ
ncbi:MAG: hypothetical protein KatS3mg060_0284 [Dehalococcoidia bacterium]|nr:MAG: hypothetical protein KatS3mg060_0284 [Dehalococcoidia bacterium]